MKIVESRTRSLYVDRMDQRILMQVAGKVRGLSLAGGPPLLTSVGTPWAGPTLEVHHMQSVEGVGESGPLDGERGMLVITDGCIDVVLREGPRELAFRARRGSVSHLNGDRRPYVLRMIGSAQAVALRLSKPWFERLLLDDVPAGFGQNVRFAQDATILALTCAMRDEVARGAITGKLYAESLSVAMLSYALDRVPVTSTRVRGDLSDEQVRRLRNHIRDNLGEDLSLTQLAALIGRSPRHFSTLFKRAFGTTPHRYLSEARLAEGARLLAQPGAEIADIALQLGFCSQSHFAESFRRKYGVTPGSYMRERRASYARAAAAGADRADLLRVQGG